MHRFALLALSAALLCSATSAGAQHLPVDLPAARGDFSGSWYNPQQSGHGLMVEVLPGGLAVMTWYTFDAQGAPMWLAGVGEVHGPLLRVPVGTVSGGAFPPLFDASQVARSAWGTLELEFTGCDQAELSWTPTAPGFSAGSMPVSRLSRVDGTHCHAAEQYGETRVFSFERGKLGFEAVFADLPPGAEDFYELEYAWETLPVPLEARRGLRLSGNNHSDDLAMLVKGALHGLRADTSYRMAMELEMATHVPSGCAGVGGSPGESVYVKLGAATQEPQAAIDDSSQGNGWLRLNIDYGQQAQGGEDALVVGNMANRHDCVDTTEAPWQLKVVSTEGQMLHARTDAEGTLWVVAGSDSGFEARTDWYLTRLTVMLDAADGSSGQ